MSRSRDRTFNSDSDSDQNLVSSSIIDIIMGCPAKKTEKEKAGAEAAAVLVRTSSLNLTIDNPIDILFELIIISPRLHSNFANNWIML